jgi:hypothetical protein
MNNVTFTYAVHTLNYQCSVRMKYNQLIFMNLTKLNKLSCYLNQFNNPDISG